MLFRSLTDPSGVASGLTSKGLAVNYTVSGDTLTASTTAGTVFTFTVNADTGAALFTLVDQLDHQPNDAAGGDAETLTIDNLGQFVRATDADGDYVDLTGLVTVTVENDVPELVAEATVSGAVVEDGLPTGLGGGAVTASLNLAGLVNTGADEELSYTLTDPSGVASGLTSKGLRSEERRVGKECRSRWSAYH